MKKILKVLATTAALASIVPFKAKADENGGSVEALLWKASWKLDPDYQSEPDVNVTFGFNNPFVKNEEEHLFADELVVDYCCDSTLQNTVAPHAESKDCCCDKDCEDDCYDEECCENGEECCCGGDCGCTE